MNNPPRTREEAEKRRYGSIAYPEYRPTQCAYEIIDASGIFSFQCKRKPCHGPDNLYCKQHAEMVGEGGVNDYQGAFDTIEEAKAMGAELAPIKGYLPFDSFQVVDRDTMQVVYEVDPRAV